MADDEHGAFDWTYLVAERKILEAMEEGLFDNLPGRGKPLDLSDNPFEPPGMRAVNRILAHNRVLPPWLLLEKEIEAGKSSVESILTRWDARVDMVRGREDYPTLRDAARADYESAMRRVNELILKYSMTSPFRHRGVVGYMIGRRLADFDSRYPE